MELLILDSKLIRNVKLTYQDKYAMLKFSFLKVPYINVYIAVEGKLSFTYFHIINHNNIIRLDFVVINK